MLTEDNINFLGKSADTTAAALHLLSEPQYGNTSGNLKGFDSVPWNPFFIVQILLSFSFESWTHSVILENLVPLMPLLGGVPNLHTGLLYMIRRVSMKMNSEFSFLYVLFVSKGTFYPL